MSTKLSHINRKPLKSQFCGYLVAKIGKRAILAILQLSFTGFVAFLFRGIIMPAKVSV